MANVTVAAAIAAYTANKNMAAVTIADTSANIAANLDALLPLVTAAKITSITQSGTAAALAITAAQLTADAAVLAKITGTYTLAVSAVAASGTAAVVANTHVTTLSVSDTAANITTNLTALIALGTKLTTITETGTITPVTLTAAQYTTTLTAKFSNFTAALTGITVATVSGANTNAKVSSFTVSDTAANIATAANITTLQTAATSGKLTSITQTGTVANITLTAAQYNATLTAKFANFSAVVTGVTAANAGTVGTDTKVASLTVTDTSANIATNLNTLQSNNAKITSITQSGTAAALAITAAQLTADAAVLAKITGTYTLAVSAVAASNVNSVFGNTHVTSITISDTAAALQLSLSAIQSNAHFNQITSINVLDASPITLTYSQFSADTNVIAKLVLGTALVVTGVATTNLSTVTANAHVTSISISDTSANILSSLNAIETLYKAGHLGTITQTNTVGSPFPISASQLAADSDVIAMLSGIKLNVTDTSANILTNLDALETIYKAGLIGSVQLSDGTPPSITLTAQQFLNDQDILVAMAANQTLGHPAYILSLVAGETLTAGQAASINQAIFENFVANSVVVKDSAANIELYAAALQNLTIDPPLGSIQLTDTGSVVLNLTSADANLFGIISTFNGAPYSLSISGVAAADVSSLLSNHLISSVSVSDTAANIQNVWHQLELASQAGFLTSIAVTDSGILSGVDNNTTGSTVTSYLSLMSHISGAGGFSLQIINGWDINNLNALQVYSLSSPLTITTLHGIYEGNSGFEIISKLNDIYNANPTWNLVIGTGGGGYTWNINTNQGPPTHLEDFAQISNVKVLEALHSIYATSGWAAVTVNVSQFLNYYASAFYAKFGFVMHGNLVGSASNIASQLDSLAQYADKLSGLPIQFTDALPPTLALDATHVMNDLAVLNAIQSSYLLSITDTVANLNVLDLSGLNANYIEITPTTLDPSNPLIITSSKVVDVNLTQLTGLASTSNVSYTEHAINGGIGTEIDVTDGTHSYVIQLMNVAQESLSVYGYVESVASVQDITTTLAQFTANLHQYETLFKAGKLSGLALTDSGSVTISVTNSELASVAGLFSLITTPYSLSINGDVAAADVSSLLSNHLISSVSVSDTAANIQSVWHQLELASQAGFLTSIAVTDSGILSGVDNSTTGSTLASYLSLMSHVSGAGGFALQLNFGLGVSSLNEIQNASLSSPLTLTSYGVYEGANYGVPLTLTNEDGGLAVIAKLNDIFNAHPSWNFIIIPAGPDLTWNINCDYGQPSHLEAFAQIDNPKLLEALHTHFLAPGLGWAAVTVNVSQFLNYYASAFYAKFGFVMHGNLVDSASNIASQLDSLAQYADKLSGLPIQFTDSQKPNIVLTPYQFEHDIAVLNLIQSDYTISIKPTDNTDLTGFNFYNGRSFKMFGDSIVVGGSFYNGITSYAGFEIINPDGSLNTSIGAKGAVLSHQAGDVAIQNVNGVNEIVVASNMTGWGQIWSSRYFMDGTLDTSYGLNGVAIDPYTSGMIGINVNPLNNHIFISGYQGFFNRPAVETELDANGNVLNSLNIGGYWSDIQGGGVAFRQNGNVIYLSGNGNLVEFNSDGTPSSVNYITPFSTAGDASQAVNATLGLQQWDGKVVEGVSYVNSSTNAMLVRYNVDGTLDTTFGNNGTVVLQYSGSSSWFGDGTHRNGIAIDSFVFENVNNDNKIVVVGNVDNHLFIKRFNGDGSLDSAFNDQVTIPSAMANDPNISHFSWYQVGLQSDGSILVYGDNQIAKYSSDGHLISYSSVGIGNIKLDMGSYGVSHQFDGSAGDLTFDFSQNSTGAPSSTNYGSIINWNGHDTISFSSLLNVVGNQEAASSGIGHIDSVTGLVTFDSSDTSLQQEINAAEAAIAAANTPASGHFAKWDNGSNTFVLITDNHTGSSVSSGDNLVELIGVTSDHIQILNGIIVAH